MLEILDREGREIIFIQQHQITYIKLIEFQIKKTIKLIEIQILHHTINLDLIQERVNKKNSFNKKINASQIMIIKKKSIRSIKKR